MLHLVLAAALDAEQICAAYAAGRYTPPPAAVAAAEACGDAPACNQELAEKFANAEGVKRDYAVAEYFLCSAQERLGVEEFEGMLGHVQEMRSGKDTSPLDFCQYVSNTYSITYCAHVHWEEAMPAFEKRIDAVRAGLSTTTGFDRLRKAAEAFVAAESKRQSEWSRGGTIHNADVLTSEVETKERFVEALEHWSRERVPASTDGEAAAADAELNASYRQARKEIDVLDEETQPEYRDMLRDAQRAWIAFRDAFAEFYAERWKGAASPQFLRTEVITQLSRDRARELREN